MLAAMSQDPFAKDALAALDSAQQQLAAAARATLEEHLRNVAQKRIDDELLALAKAGIRGVDASDAYEAVVRRRSPQ
jgi:hypothetical protein